MPDHRDNWRRMDHRRMDYSWCRVDDCAVGYGVHWGNHVVSNHGVGRHQGGDDPGVRNREDGEKESLKFKKNHLLQ